MSTLSAAQRLQQAHDQASQQQQQQSQAPVDTTDPFPVLSEDPFPVATSTFSSSYSQPQSQPKQQQPKKQVNVNDESAFPSLGGGGGAAVKSGGNVGGGWGNNSGLNKIKQSTPTTSTTSSSNGTSTPTTAQPATVSSSENSATLNFSIPTSSIQITSPSSSSDGSQQQQQRRNGLFSNDPRLKSGPPTTLGEVLKYLQTLPHNKEVSIQASSSSKLTTFIIKAQGVKGRGAQEEVERAKGELLGWLEKKVRVQVKVPKGLRAVIIGAKGKAFPSF